MPIRTALISRFSLPLVALAALALAAMLLSDAGGASASTFSLTASACVDNEATADPDLLKSGSGAAECDGNSAAGASSGVVTGFDLPAGDANFSVLVNFIPPQWGVTPGSQVADGALVGMLSALAGFGIVDNACNNQITAFYNLFDATTDPTSTVSFGAGFADANSDNLPDAVTKYPDFLTRMFPGKTPRERLYAQANVAGGVLLSVNTVIFEPGTPIGLLVTDPRLGFPTVTVLLNIGDPGAVPAPGAINDLCSPRVSSTLVYSASQDNPATAANEGGVTYRSNPSAAGAYNFVTFTSSLRDADNDGIENELDPCPLSADLGWDPRTGSFATPQTGDADGDRVPDSCDPEDNSQPPSSDVDSDGYVNTGDNCATAANGTAQDNQKDSDFDGIGDACDQAPAVPDGHLHFTCLVKSIQIGTGGSTPIDPLTVQPCNPSAPLPTATPAATATPTATPVAPPGSGGSPDAGGSDRLSVFAVIAGAAAIALAAGGWYARRRLRR